MGSLLKKVEGSESAPSLGVVRVGGQSTQPLLQWYDASLHDSLATAIVPRVRADGQRAPRPGPKGRLSPHANLNEADLQADLPDKLS